MVVRAFLCLFLLLLLYPACSSESQDDLSSISAARPITLKQGVGTVLLSRGRQELVETVSAGSRLPDGVSILAPAKGFADVQCKGLLIRVWSDSAVRLDLAHRSIYLLRGHAMIYVSKRYDGEPLRLCTEKYFCSLKRGCYGVGTNQFLQQENVSQRPTLLQTAPDSSISKVIASSRFHKYSNSIAMHR